jgi:hypothetical protein
MVGKHNGKKPSDRSEFMLEVIANKDLRFRASDCIKVIQVDVDSVQWRFSVNT